MLDYLGEPGARQAAEALGSLDAVTEQARAEILRTFEPLRACDAKLGPAGVSVCVHNGTADLLRAVVISERGVSGPRHWRVEDLFQPGRGLRVGLPLEGGTAPLRLEVGAGAASNVPVPVSPDP
jgi:hypothetical protein